MNRRLNIKRRNEMAAVSQEKSNMQRPEQERSGKVLMDIKSVSLL